MLIFLKIAQRLRPRWVVWENVPGVLSSNGGRDFGSFLGALGELGYGWAYRVLDAQWFGVAQRRRRVFVVGHLGNWELAAKVLFESESVRRDSPPSREAGQGASTNAQEGLGERDVSPTLTKRMQGSSGWAPYNEDAHLVPIAEKEVVGCLSDGAHMGGGLTGRTPTAEELWQLQAYRMQAFGEYMNDETASAMKARDYKDATDLIAIPIHDQATRNAGKRGDKQDGKDGRFVDEMSPTLRKDMGDNQVAIASRMAVRRLTPKECERLQGFPDDHTLIPWRNKPADQCPDGPRYKALGNSMAVPCMRWIGERIARVENERQGAA